MDRSSNLYILNAKLINFRKFIKIWEKEQVQRYADDIFYSFTRGEILCLFTNTYNMFYRDITYHNYVENQKLCNILKSDDCISVINHTLRVVMNGDFKVYVPVEKYFNIITLI